MGEIPGSREGAGDGGGLAPRIAITRNLAAPRRARKSVRMTIISHKRKFIFICPANVAGTSIMASLAAHCADGDVVIFGHRGAAYKPDVDDDDIREIFTRNAGVFAGLPAGRGPARRPHRSAPDT